LVVLVFPIRRLNNPIRYRSKGQRTNNVNNVEDWHTLFPWEKS